jgi:hypothetical protein
MSPVVLREEKTQRCALVPDIVETILAGRAGPALMLGQLERSLPARWEEQRTLFKPRALCLP